MSAGAGVGVDEGAGVLVGGTGVFVGVQVAVGGTGVFVAVDVAVGGTSVLIGGLVAVAETGAGVLVALVVEVVTGVFVASSAVAGATVGWGDVGAVVAC
jgi:hypothetical protein